MKRLFRTAIPLTKLMLYIILGVLLIGGIVWWLFVPPRLTRQLHQPIPRNQPVAQNSRITLSQTISITPMPGNYTDDNHIWRLVNKTTPLKNRTYRPDNLQLATVAIRTDKSPDEQSLRADIMPEVEQLFTAAQHAGHSLQIGSAFRSYELQQLYYTNYSRLYGQDAADLFSAKPGYSEHQTGLVMDIATTDHTCYLDTCFGETAAGKWLAQHAHEYGFIVRYPKGKEAITGYQYEPWHFRYVGKELATALYHTSLTLDQAMPLLLRATTQ